MKSALTNLKFHIRSITSTNLTQTLAWNKFIGHQTVQPATVTPNEFRAVSIPTLASIRNSEKGNAENPPGGQGSFSGIRGSHHLKSRGIRRNSLEICCAKSRIKLTVFRKFFRKHKNTQKKNNIDMRRKCPNSYFGEIVVSIEYGCKGS